MPITRFQLRNEYGLGTRELYRESAEKEDPKAVLDGVAVAGLVGVLRQLGDLADFAADVFHSLQEQVMITSSRNRKLMSRVKHVEAALPSLEKAILTQTSHIHFAYTPGSEWHARVASEQNQFIYSDLPRCIMNLYEECKEPPRLQQLDRFNTDGPGSCLKKYSDPNFFQRASGNFSLNAEKSQNERKSRKIKKRKSTKRGSHNAHDSSSIGFSSRVHFSPPSRHQQSSPTHTVSTFDMTFKSDVVDLSDSLGSGDRSGFIECVFHPTTSTKPNEENSVHSPSCSNEEVISNNEANHTAAVEDNRSRSSISGKSAPSPSSVTWDEKLEISEPVVSKNEVHDLHQVDNKEFEFSENEIVGIFRNSENNEVSKVQEEIFEHDDPQMGHVDRDSDSDLSHRSDEMNLEVYDARLEPRDQSLWINELHVTNDDAELEPKDGRLLINNIHETNADCSDMRMKPIGQIPQINEAYEVDGRELQLSKVEPALLESDNKLSETFEGQVKALSYYSEDQHDEDESETDNFVDALNTIESESESDLDCQTKKEIKSFSDLTVNSKDHVEHEQIESINNRLVESESPSATLDNLDRAWLMALDDPASQLPAVEQSLEGAPSCNGDGQELNLNPNDSIFSAYSVVDTAQPGPMSYLSFPTCQEPLGAAASASDISGEVREKSDRMGSSENVAKNTGLEDITKSTVQHHSSENDSGVCANQVNVSELQSSVGKSESTVPGKLPPAECGVQPPPFSHQPPFGPHAIISSTLWTNGCLLGLQPSKPMDLGTSDATRPDGITLATVNLENRDMLSVGDQSSQHVNYSLDAEPAQNQPATDPIHPEIMDQPSQHFNYSLDAEQAQNQPATDPIHPEIMNFAVSDAMSAPNEMLHVDEKRFSLPGFGGGLMSRFKKTRSIGYDEKAKSDDSQKPHNLRNGHEEQMHHSLHVSNSHEQISSISSPPPSPPLEHVRISFQPISSLETSKLKLKYPEGTDQHEESIDAFPSFQLVPEPANLPQGVGSDSDDDTFCRSNPYMSEDELSHLSDSNSELWDSGDTSGSRGHTGFNGLHKVSSEESISSPSELDTEANKIPSDDSGSIQTNNKIGGPFSSLGPLPNMPVFCNVNPLYQEAKIRIDPKESAVTFSLRELTPQPPPLPPLQWRISRSLSAFTEGDVGNLNNHFCLSTDSVNQVTAYDQQNSVPAERDHLQKSAPVKVGHQLKSAPVKVDHQQKSAPAKADHQQKSAPTKVDHQLKSAPDEVVGLPVTTKDMFLGGQKLKFSAQEKVSQTAKLKVVDEREDFLQQIRAKSFNLRKTGISRGGFAPPAPSMHVQVTAILEKAKTVRRAVASDGEDGWSDT